MNGDGQPPRDWSRSTKYRVQREKRLNVRCKDQNCTVHTLHNENQRCTDDEGEDSHQGGEHEMDDSFLFGDVHNDHVSSDDGSSQPTMHGTIQVHSTPHSETGSHHMEEPIQEHQFDDNMSAPSYRSSDSEFDDSCEDIVMHFLNEHPNQPIPVPQVPEDPGDGNFEHIEDAGDGIPDPGDGHGGGDPEVDDPPGDDPDDPPVSEESDADDSDLDDEGGDTFSFDDVRMNTPLEFGHAGCTVREGILLNLSLAVKYHWTYEALADSMASWSTGLGRRGIIPETKKQLWKLIQKSEAGITKYAYCPNCLAKLGRYNLLEDGMIQCQEEECGVRTHKRQVPFFLSLNLQKQFQQLLSTPGIAHHLQYRARRRKHRDNAMEDIFDGEVYRNLVADGTITDNDFTYIMNTDGFTLFKHRSVCVWGLLLRLNELPPNMRQKHMFLAALWIGKKQPRMNTFLAPFVSQANRLSRHGLLWRPDGVNEITSKFKAIGLAVDAQARAKCMNQHQYNGEYGCYACTHHGIVLDGCMKYPLLPYGDLPEAIDRTNQTIGDAMDLNAFHEGQKGPSELALLDDFDLASGQCMDDLHPFYEGVAAFFCDLLTPQLRNEAQSLATVNFRMRDIRTPVQMARKWISIGKRNSWKGSQWGYFIRYLSVLCFIENSMTIRNLEHLSMLSYALFVFSQDSIEPAEFERASQYADRFVALFQQYYGAENMRFNIHMLTHLAQARRRWASAWTTSTFNFESWNGQLGLHVTSAKGAADQIVLRHLLKLYVHSSPHRNDISQRVKDHVSDVLFATQRKVAEAINDDIYVLGRGRVRPATLEEQNMLRREGIENRNLTVYDRMLVRGIEFRIRTYHEDTRSDNSNVFTWDNRFLTIQNIIVLELENGDKVCWVFAGLHTVDYPIQYAHHIGHILRSEETLVRPEIFRVPVIKAVIQEQTYVVPMANCREID